jgi:hypothetical protein
MASSSPPRNPDLFNPTDDGWGTYVTLRDLFAGFAVTGLVSEPGYRREDVIREAFALADALLAVRAAVEGQR